VLPTDTLLTLSTCVYVFRDARFTVQARLLRDGESLDDFIPRAELNKKRKPYNIPMERSLAAVPANRAALMQLPHLHRYYIVQPGGDGIEWYASTIENTYQGPYTAWEGSIESAYYSWAAAGTVSTRQRDSYIVSGGLRGNQPGLHVLHRRGTPGGLYALAGNGTITPEGVDARWPALYVGPSHDVTVFYTADEGTERLVYFIPIGGGIPKHVYTTDAEHDARPVCVLETGTGPLLLLQKFTTGIIHAVHVENGTSARVGMPGTAGRYTVFHDAQSGELRYFHEKDGRLETGVFDSDWILSIP